MDQRVASSFNVSYATIAATEMEQGEATPINVSPASIATNEEMEYESCIQEMTTMLESKYGGSKIAILLLVNQALVNIAFFGVGVNLVLFLTRVLGQDNAQAANNVSIWTGTVYIFSLVGAFISDSYLGRYKTCIIFQLIFILGLGLLSLSSWLYLIKPTGCGNEDIACNPSSSLGIYFFYCSMYLVAFGYGGHQPNLATFGADQYNEKCSKEKVKKSAFFCYFYFFLNVGSLFSNTVLVFYEDSGEWIMGFSVALGSAVVALLSFLLGYRMYRYVNASGNPVVRVAQVFVAAARKGGVDKVKSNKLYEVEGKESAIKGCRKIVHSDEFEFLDKAATMVEDDNYGIKTSPWKLCTVTQVEEVKCMLRILPVWLCTIIYSIMFTQMASLFVEQGDVMNSYVGNIHLPAASMSVFNICSVLISTGILRAIIIPIGQRLTGNPKGFTELQRMGIGLIIGILAMIAAGVTEVERLKYVVPVKKASSLRIFWQAPQYILVGVSEVFMYVGQLEFFNGQAPDGIKSFGSSLCMASISLGNFGSTMLVDIVIAITTRGNKLGWIPDNLNEGHLDRFFFLLALLGVVDFIAYLLCANWYKEIKVEEDSEIEGKDIDEEEWSNNI